MIPRTGVALVSVDDPENSVQLGCEAELTIGRSKSCNLVINDDAISSHHAVIRTDEGEFIVIDQQSTNGTYVNNERIQQPTQLSDDDELRFGTTRYRFVNKESADIVSKTVVMPLPAVPSHAGTCTQCGTSIRTEFSFCTHCGYEAVTA